MMMKDPYQICEEIGNSAHKIIIIIMQGRTLWDGDLIWRCVHENIKDPHDGKLGSNWKGPYQICEEIGNSAHELQTLRKWGKDSL